MAWTAPRTWIVGELVAAAVLNVHVRDNLIDLKSSLDALQALDFPAVTLSNQFNASANRNVGTAETSLFSYTVPANTWDADGRIVRVTISAQCANTVNNKVFRLYLGGTGGTKLWDSGSTTIQAWHCPIEADITRTAAGAQYSTVSTIWESAAPGAGAQSEERTTSAEDETAALDLVFTGQSSVGSDEIFAYQMLVEKAA